MSKPVFAVLITFHPDLGHLGKLIDNLNPQVSRTVVVDNGSPPEALAWLTKRAGLGQFAFLPLGANFGIAHAQNQGIRHAMAEGADFVLLMDQDSMPCSGMVAELQRAATSLSNAGHRVAAVGPVCAAACDAPDTTVFLAFDRFPPTKRRCAAGAGEVATDQLIASGMLIPVSAFEAVGPMDDALFIDQVETDWCLRARAMGMALFGICGARLVHEIGQGVARIWLGRWRTVAIHPPVRNYYFLRNSLVLLGRPHATLHWRLYMTYVLAKWTLRTVFLPPRLSRTRMILKALLHAVAARLGPL